MTLKGAKRRRYMKTYMRNYREQKAADAHIDIPAADCQEEIAAGSCSPTGLTTVNPEKAWVEHTGSQQLRMSGEPAGFIISWLIMAEEDAVRPY